MSNHRPNRIQTATTAPACVPLTRSEFAEGEEHPFAPVTIPPLPFSDAGDRPDNIDDFDVACPLSESSSSDVFYAYDLMADGTGDLPRGMAFPVTNNDTVTLERGPIGTPPYQQLGDADADDDIGFTDLLSVPDRFGARP